MKHLWLPTLLSAAVGAALLLAGPASARPDPDDPFAALQREIAALRVLHALALDDEQADALLPLVEDGIALAAELDAVHARHRDDALPVLQRVRDDLADDGVVEAETEALAKDARERAVEDARPVHEELRALAAEAAALLDEEQRRDAADEIDDPPEGPLEDEEHAGRRFRPAGSGDDGAHAIPAGVAQRARLHHARALFRVVFSDAFLQALLDRG